jgi:putative phage-type endonuclease
MSDQVASDLMKGIGGSEAAAVLGFNKYKTPYQVWAEKTGKVPPPDLSGNEAVRIGKMLEKPVLEMYAEKTGRDVVPLFDRLFVSETHPFLLCHPDGKIEDQDRGVGVYEGKVSNTPDWEEGVPLMYQIQGQHNLFVTGASWLSIANLYGNKLLFWDFDRQDRFIGPMVERLERFWKNHVLADIPPEVVGADNAFIQKVYPYGSDQKIQLPSFVLDLDQELMEIKERIKDDEARKDEIEARIKAALGDASVGFIGNGFQYTFRYQERAEYTVKAWSGRVLRRSKEK